MFVLTQRAQAATSHEPPHIHATVCQLSPQPCAQCYVCACHAVLIAHSAHSAMSIRKGPNTHTHCVLSVTGHGTYSRRRPHCRRGRCMLLTGRGGPRGEGVRGGQLASSDAHEPELQHTATAHAPLLLHCSRAAPAIRYPAVQAFNRTGLQLGGRSVVRRTAATG